MNQNNLTSNCIKISLFIFIYFLPIVNGFYINISNEAFKTHYVPSEKLTGYLNLSLIDIPASSLLQSNFGGSIGIMDFLINNSAVYSCIPLDCRHSYIRSDPALSKSFYLESGKEKILGLTVEGDLKDDGVSDFKFQVKSNAPASCVNPLSIDLLDDKDPQYAFNLSSQDYSCYATRGCFTNESLKDVQIDDREYCNKMTLVPAPSYKIGAFVKRAGQVNLSMKLKRVLENNQSEDIEGAFCMLPSFPEGIWNERECSVEYAVATTGDFYVCITALAGVGIATLQYEEKSPLCGYYDFIEDNYTVDYHLSAKAARYDSFKNFTFDQSSQNVNALSLTSYISEYLEKRYGGNCRNGCIVPVAFISGVGQEIIIDNLSLAYSTQVGPKISHEVFDVEKKDSVLSMEFQKVEIARAEFQAPESYGEFPLVLSIDANEFFRKNISIKKVPIISSIAPRNIPQSVATTFTVNARSPENKSFSRFFWDFGDNVTTETAVNEAVHRYSKIGIYILKVTAVDDEGEEGTGSFQIIVGSAKDAVNQTLKELKSKLSSLQSNLSFLWYRMSLKEILKLNESEKALQDAQRAFVAARGDNEYGKVALKLEEIRLPWVVQEGNTVNIPFVFDLGTISFEHLKDIGAGEIEEDNQGKYKSAIGAWFSSLQKMKEYKITAAYYNDNAEILGIAFKITVDSPDDKFIIIERPLEQIQFYEDYKVTNLGGAVGIALSGKKSFIFFVKGKGNPEDIPMYLAPVLANLEVTVATEPCNYNKECETELGESSGNCKADCPPNKLTLIFLMLLVLGALVIYTIVQEWYRKRYEKHLFKSKADIFNLMNFVGNGLKHGLQKNEIAIRLKESGWNQEEITFIFKKIEGKRLGMPGFNIIEILERMKNKKRFQIASANPQANVYSRINFQ